MFPLKGDKMNDTENEIEPDVVEEMEAKGIILKIDKYAVTSLMSLKLNLLKFN